MATPYFNEDFHRADHSLQPEQHAAGPLDILLLMEALEDAEQAELAFEALRDQELHL